MDNKKVDKVDGKGTRNGIVIQYIKTVALERKHLNEVVRVLLIAV